MVRRFAISILVVAALLAGRVAFAESGIPKQGVPLVPDGVSLGMGEAELLALRPGLRPMSGFGDKGRNDATTKPKPREQLFMEAHGEREMRSAASYVVRDGKLAAVSVQERLPVASYAKTRNEMLATYLATLGGAPERYVRQVKGVGFDYAAPCFLWNTADGIVMVCFMPVFTEVTPHAAEVQIWLMSDRKLLDQIAQKSDPEKDASVFAGLVVGPRAEAAPRGGATPARP